MKLADLPGIEFVDADAEHVKAALFADYISITGRTLAQGDPVRLFLLVLAEAFIRLLNNQNYVGKQNLLRYATGDNLDHSGLLIVFFTTSASELPSFDASKKTSIGTCWLVATANGLEPRLPICTSPEASARTMLAPLSNLRQSTVAPLSLAKVLSA